MDRSLHRLRDIVDAIDQIDMLARGRTLADLTQDRIMRAAFERFLEIISEASRHVQDDLRGRANEIPWRRVADLGNHLRHAYQKIDAETLWNLHANGELALLRKAALRLMQEAGR